MKTPCEIITTKVLPAIRAAIVKSLYNDHNMKQLETAQRLGITQASVSKYLTSTRGSNYKIIRTFPQIGEYAKIMANKIASCKDKRMEIDLCAICKKIRKTKSFSDLYLKSTELSSCKICSYKQ